MSWKNFKIAKKLYIGFSLVLVLFIVVGAFNYKSFSDIQIQTEYAQDTCGNQAFAIAKEVDHLKWITSLSNLFLDDHVTEVTVETDDHKCGLGKWLYSEETKAMAVNSPN